MKNRSGALIVFVAIVLSVLAGCTADHPVDVDDVLSQPKSFVGADVCKKCHLEHFDSWKMTRHSRVTQDARLNRDAIMADYKVENIRKDLLAYKGETKVPADKIYIPKLEEIKYTIGSERAQAYVIEKNGVLYVAPLKYDVKHHIWSPREEDTWDKAPFLENCSGCHVTGADIKTRTFKELTVSCESCHGKGSWHAALPKTEVFKKRATIINPAKLPMGAAVQICGSCHTRGVSTKNPQVRWPMGYEPGRPLDSYFKPVSYAAGDTDHKYPNDFSKSAWQQYLDWQKSIHAEEGVSCTSCHYVHQLGIPRTSSQTIESGSQQCLLCHTRANSVGAHAIHSFSNCVGCHMPRIAGGTRSHTFTAILPSETVKNPEIPNSCQACHKHKDTDLEELDGIIE